jgi:hypothetical protein
MEWEYYILSDSRVGNKYDAEESAKSRLNDLGPRLGVGGCVPDQLPRDYVHGRVRLQAGEGIRLIG